MTLIKNLFKTVKSWYKKWQRKRMIKLAIESNKLDKHIYD